MGDEKKLPVLSELPIELERDSFMRTLLRELSGTLQDVVGLDQAGGFISVVGQRMGDQIDAMYRQALGAERLDKEQVADVLVDLKRRIQGDFYIIAQDEDKIVYGNRACPFGEKVIDRPALCMMTSNVFGVVAAENLGYSKIAIEDAIAVGSDGCRVVVYIRRSPESESAEGREYFQSESKSSKS